MTTQMHPEATSIYKGYLTSLVHFFWNLGKISSRTSAFPLGNAVLALTAAMAATVLSEVIPS